MDIHANFNLNLTRDQVIRIITLVEDGRSQRYVANLVGVNQSTVSRVVSRYQETGGFERRPVQGRPKATTPADNRFLSIQALRRRHVTSTQLQHDLAATRNTQVSSHTVDVA
jgi:transposase